MSLYSSPAQSAYPVPEVQPTYQLGPQRRPAQAGRLYALIDGSFVVLALALTFAFAWLLLSSGLSFSWHGVVLLIAFWGVLTYLALPRLHQLLTTFYLPDYFMARTKTGDGLLGDPVNLALIGSEDDIHHAMQSAGWIKADPITLRTSLGIIKSALMKTSYPEAPVSDLYLFENKHDFAYQQEVDGNASQRHHVRFWKAPDGWELPGGQSVNWMAAGTYDVRVGLSSWTLQVTHKIDANIDAERDYIINTVRYADPDTSVSVLPRFTPAFHAKNGGGDAVHTDGNMPILDVSGAAQREIHHTQRQNTDMPVLAIPQADQTMDKELPPKGLNVAGVIIAAKVMLSVVDLITLLLSNEPELSATVSLAAEAAFSAVMLVLWWNTVKAHRFSRLLLLIVVGLSSVFELVSVYSAPAPGLLAFGETGLTLLVLLSLTAPEVRQWVSSQHQSATNR